MAFTIDAKNIIRGGAVMAALVTMSGGAYGAFRWLDPYFQTSPPFAEEGKLLAIAQTQQQQQATQVQMQSTQLFLLQQFWVNQQVEAQIALRKDPSDQLAAKQLSAANAALAGVQRQLYGK